MATEDGASDAGAVELDVYLRTSAADGARRRQRAVIERVEHLREDGMVGGTTVRRWSDRIAVPVGIDPDGTDSAAIAVFEELSAATEDTGVSLEPGFEERDPLGPPERVVVFPVMAVAVRRGDELRGIYPCVVGDRCDTVGNCLDALEAGERAENLPE